MDRTFTSFSAFVLLGVVAADLRQALIFVVCLVVATAFHEFAHAFAADRLGDPTPGRDGRLTLNPLAHADPVGTIGLPLMAGLLHLPLFGWGRPVMTQPRFYTRGMSMRAGMALVSFAGPLANVLQATVTLLAIKLLLVAGVEHKGLFEVLVLFFTLNLTLAVFNLLPVHPLDGGKILAWALPARFSHIDDTLARYGWTILLALMLIPGLLQTLFTPVGIVRDWALRLVVG
ncbi:site-2 protease family protein [Nannocystis sp.]|uniref:site-2 protease family protein n=1 Tax=Nannocystis sp. TaxID=1962667 RepID=UPI0025FA1078|nr:site-2 protease family protein [Nannocystis sp.]MBK7829508.1 site-2 protease family protein [Nannocystis sp.]